MLGIQHIFVNHYDLDLKEKRPFGVIWDTLAYRDEQLKLLPARSPSNPRRLRPEDLRGNDMGTFCHGALQILNGRDKGRVSMVEKKDLLEENRRQMQLFGGAFLYWQCPHCAYKVRYHLLNSLNSSIHLTDEVRGFEGVQVQLRSSFLAKCHLYLPLPEQQLLGARGRLESVVSATTPKYGCVFCYGAGKDLERGRTSFATAGDLAEHIAAQHRKTLPPTLMLHRFDVAIAGKSIDTRRKWDVNLL
jgi:hypothetical protein